LTATLYHLTNTMNYEMLLPRDSGPAHDCDWKKKH